MSERRLIWPRPSHRLGESTRELGISLRSSHALTAALAVAIALAACGGSARTKAAGVLTGMLRRCTAYVQTRTVEVTGLDGKVVATQRVADGSSYRFVLPPGRYFISTGGPLDRAHPDMLAAGQPVHQDFPPYFCE
jgi:hypothetical protein